MKNMGLLKYNHINHNNEILLDKHKRETQTTSETHPSASKIIHQPSAFTTSETNLLEPEPSNPQPSEILPTLTISSINTISEPFQPQIPKLLLSQIQQTQTRPKKQPSIINFLSSASIHNSF